ncbi:MAG: vitamin K epoxide reductase family protein [Planctomycetota bacterium]
MTDGPARGPSLRLAAMLVLATAGALFSAALLRHHLNPAESWSWARAICGGEAESSCDVVNRSAAAAVLGVPIAGIGFVYYLTIAVLAVIGWLEPRTAYWRLLMALTVLGFLVDVGLFSYSVFGLEAICGLCAVTYGVTALLLILSVSLLRSGGTPEQRRIPARARVALLAFGGIAVLATCGFWHEHWGAAVRGAERLFEDPDEALRVAWTVFHRKYVESEPIAIPGDRPPTKGATQPIMTLTLFADFLCSHCRRSAKLLSDFAEAHRDTVALQFRNYPLDDACNPESEGVHPGACLLARAALAAGRQGRFWYYHDLLFANQNIWRSGVQVTQLVHLADQAGLDAEQFGRDIARPDIESAVIADIEAAHAIGVESTPTLFINGREMQSIPIRTFLEELLRAEAGHQQAFQDQRAISKRKEG